MTDNPHLACPFEDCGSSDAFNWNDDGYGFCHSCGESYPSKKNMLTFDWVAGTYPLKQRISIMDIPVKSSTFNDIRGLNPDICQVYGIQVQLGEDNKPVRYALQVSHTRSSIRDYNDKSSLGKDRGWV